MAWVLLDCTLKFTILLLERKESIFKPTGKIVVLLFMQIKMFFFFSPVSFRGGSISYILKILTALVRLLLSLIITRCD